MRSQGLEPRHCPLCGQANACANQTGDAAVACWCADKRFVFPEGLLQQVPAAAKSKACICRRCVEAYHHGLKKGQSE